MESKQCSNFNCEFYSHGEDLPVEYDGSRITTYLSHCGEVVLLGMIELTDSFKKNRIAVMEFTAKHSIYQILSLNDIINKINFYYATELCVATMKSAKNTGEFWTL